MASLFKYLTKPAQPGYRKVSLRQVLRADKLAFAKMSEAGEDTRADASGVLPLDQMISSILQDYDLIVAILPLGDLEGLSGKNRNGRGGRPRPVRGQLPVQRAEWQGQRLLGSKGLRQLVHQRQE